MAKSTKRLPENGERVRRTDTGEEATFVVKHSSQSYSNGVLVLLDHGPKEGVTWSDDIPIERVGGRRRSNCDRCGGKGHMAFYCPEGDLP